MTDDDTDHLNSSHNINITVQAEATNLIDDHVNHDEGSRPTDSRGAVNYDRTGAVCK